MCPVAKSNFVKGYYRLLEIKKEDPMLDAQTFKTVIENAPLVSIDLCLVCDGEVWLDQRFVDSWQLLMLKL